MDNVLNNNNDTLVRALDRIESAARASIATPNLETEATRVIYAGGNGAPAYTAPDKTTVIITRVMCYDSANATCDIQVDSTVAWKATPPTTTDHINERVWIEIPAGKDLDLAGADNWYLTGYIKGEV